MCASILLVVGILLTNIIRTRSYPGDHSPFTTHPG